MIGYKTCGGRIDMRIRTEIITETDRIILVSGRASITAWCAICSQRSTLVTPEQAAIIIRTGARAIYRLIETACAEQVARAPRLPSTGARAADEAYAWVEAGRLHFFETTEGLLFVCLNSLR
jgi:hypothetical protein